jgi:FMN phosphatase YigB (HAD superfamily)
MSEIKVVFFDIGDTLAVAHISPSGDLALKPLPDVPEVLEKLQDAHLRLGIISNTGEYNAQMMRAALEEAGLFAFFANNPRLLIYSFEVHLTKNSPEIFSLAVKRTRNKSAKCLYVGEDAGERRFAIKAGLQVAATPAEALAKCLG